MMKQQSHTRHFPILAIVVFAFFFGAVDCSWAYIYHSGKYTFDIEVRNSIQMLIPGAKVSIMQEYEFFIVEARAAGYVSRTIQIPRTQATYYKRIINLSDPKKHLKAQDTMGDTLASVYFRTDQYGIAPDKYGILAAIPEAVWPKPVVKNVVLYDTSWGMSFKFDGSIEKGDGYYFVRLVVSRKLLNISGPEWVIAFDTRKSDGQLSREPHPQALKAWLERLAVSEKAMPTLSPAEAEPLVDRMAGHLDRASVEALGIPLPSALAARYAEADRFDRLHRDLP